MKKQYLKYLENKYVNNFSNLVELTNYTGQATITEGSNTYIAFDYHVINYLVHPDACLDNNICKDERFIKSLSYIVNLNYKYLDYVSYVKIKNNENFGENIISIVFAIYPMCRIFNLLSNKK